MHDIYNSVPEYNRRTGDNTDTTLEKLQSWRKQLPIGLAMPDDFDHSDPSCHTLHMTYNQLIISATRSYFLDAVGRELSGERSPESRIHSTYIQKCTRAANNNLLLAQNLVNSGRKLLHISAPYVLDAATLLLLRRILPDVLGDEQFDPDAYDSSIHFAFDTFQDDAKTSTTSCRSYGNLLHDLSMLIKNYLSRNERSNLRHGSSDI
jgi:hypothetical protein